MGPQGPIKIFYYYHIEWNDGNCGIIFFSHVSCGMGLHANNGLPMLIIEKYTKEQIKIVLLFIYVMFLIKLVRPLSSDNIYNSTRFIDLKHYN